MFYDNVYKVESRVYSEIYFFSKGKQDHKLSSNKIIKSMMMIDLK